MTKIKETIGRLYFEKANQIFVNLRQDVFGGKDGTEYTFNGQEAVYRIVFVLLIIGILTYSLSIPHIFFEYLFAIFVGGISSVLIILFWESRVNNGKIKNYKEAEIKWESLDPSLKNFKKKEIIQDFYQKKFNRKLSYGELIRIQKKAECEVSFRLDKYLGRDRLLAIGFLLFSPFLKNWNEGFVWEKIIRGTMCFIVSVFAFTLMSIAFVFQDSIVRLLHLYVMRGLQDDCLTFTKQQSNSNKKDIDSKESTVGRNPGIDTEDKEQVEIFKKVSRSLKVGPKRAINTKTTFWNELACELKDHGIIIKGDTIRQNYSDLLPEKVNIRLNKLN